MRIAALSRAVAYEWMRIRSVRLTWWIAGISIAATALAGWGYSALVSSMLAADQRVDDLEALVMIISKPSFVPIAASVLGVVAVGNDYRYGTMAATLLITPRRTVALAAKALVVTGFGIALTAVGLAVTWAVGFLVIGRGLTASASALDLVSLQAGQVALTVGSALLGIFVTVLARSQLTGLVTVFAVPYAIEPAVRTMVLVSGQHSLEKFVGFLPFAAGNAMTDISHGASDTLLATNAIRLGPLTGALVFFGLIAAVGAWALVRFLRQDLK